MALYDYDSWYIGGHSLGGAMAASYAAKKGTPLNGVILLAAYPIKALDSGLLLISIYGSEDGILNMDKLSQSIQFAPDNYPAESGQPVGSVVFCRLKYHIYERR